MQRRKCRSPLRTIDLDINNIVNNLIAKVNSKSAEPNSSLNK